MKFASAFLALVGSSVVVNGATLRANAATSHHLDTKVTIKGVRGEPSAEDMEIISKAFVASYSDVHWQAGHYLTGSYAAEPLGFVDGSSYQIAISAPFERPCRRCSNDDSIEAGLLTTALTNECGGMCNKDASADLETTFCNKIRDSGSAYLKSASHCNIQFEQQDNKMSMMKVQEPVANDVATVDTTLILKGVNGAATSEEDLAVIAKAYVSAYNDVHWDAVHYMAGAEIPFVAGTPDIQRPCRRCSNDDSVEAGTNTLVLDIVTPIIGRPCRRCSNDDADEYLSDIESNELTKKAIEAAFCKKLQASISDKLRDTKLCSIAMETVVISNNDGFVSA